jgi:hypothetical protein
LTSGILVAATTSTAAGAGSTGNGCGKGSDVGCRTSLVNPGVKEDIDHFGTGRDFAHLCITEVAHNTDDCEV